MNIALILSGGTGTRLGGDIPKQYIQVNGKPIISYCLDIFRGHKTINKIHIVADEQWHKLIYDEMGTYKLGGFSLPGQTRQLSILNGLADIMQYADSDDYVIVHDAARPLVSPQMIIQCLDAAKNHDGAIPVLPMKDTVYFSGDTKTISKLVDRSKIFAGQAPEVFKLSKYYKANIDLLPDKILAINGSTEPAVIAGMDIVMIPGDENNFKITTQNDLERFRKLKERDT